MIVPAEGWLILEVIEDSPLETVHKGKIVGYNTKIGLHEGDIVYYSRYMSASFERENKGYVFLKDDRYFGVERERAEYGPSEQE